MTNQAMILNYLTALYGKHASNDVFARLNALLGKYRSRLQYNSTINISERDTILITYGDQVQEKGKAPLQTLAEFCESNLRGIVSGIHILPFYPWSSDDGFSVTDYRVVDPALGDWEHIERLGKSFRLMFDGVINHMSAQGEWF